MSVRENTEPDRWVIHVTFIRETGSLLHIPL